MELKFLSNEADEDDGLGHAGIETYTDQPYSSTARECGQNSSDAKEKKPVIIKFDSIDVPVEEISQYNKLLSTVNCCLTESQYKSCEKSKEFFKEAKTILERERISVLRIADYNTKGLIGPCEPGKPFHSLVKATGVSIKDNDASGGSFGIGKNAVFAISDLRTVFYSTKYNGEDERLSYLMQGKSILISHEDDDGKSKRSIGYWGESHFKPVTDEQCVAPWLRRDSLGTSIFAIGFRHTPNWKYRMAASLIRNFFVAIYRGEMEFILDDDSVNINSTTLADYFKDEDIVSAALESNQEAEFLYARCLFECLTSEESKKTTFKIDGLGDVHFTILVKENLPKKLSIIRNGMIITNSLAKFGNSFSKFRMCRDFVAFVEPAGDEGSSFLKRLENPRHDDFSAERISDERKRKDAIKSMKCLIKNIRESIKKETMSAPQEVQSLDELSEFFADNQTTEPIQDPNSTDDPENYVYTPQKRAPRKQDVPKTRGMDSDGGSGEGEGGSGGGNKIDGTGSGSGEGGTGTRIKSHIVKLLNIRNTVITSDDIIKRKVWFTSSESEEVTLSVWASGINSNDEIKITGTSHGVIDKGRLNIEVLEGKRNTIELTIAENYRGPIEVLALLADKVARDAN